MKRSLLLLLPSLLAGCGSGNGGEPADNEALAAAAAANAALANSAEPAADEAARIQALIAKAMPGAIADAADAQYRNLRLGAGGAACGEVASKPAGRAAPVFRPFVINPDGYAVVAASPKLAFDDPGDFVADAWIRWCATPEELQKLAPELHRAAADPAAAPMNAIGAGADTPVPDAAPPPAPPSSPPQARPSNPPPPARVDSFFNSIQHKE
jgi:hypothetical protein